MGLFGSRISNAFYEKGLKATYQQNENNTQTVFITPYYKETSITGSVHHGIATFMIHIKSEECYGYFEYPEKIQITLNGCYDSVVIEEIKESLHVSTIIRKDGPTESFDIKKEEVTYRNVLDELTATWKARNDYTY